MIYLLSKCEEGADPTPPRTSQGKEKRLRRRLRKRMNHFTIDEFRCKCARCLLAETQSQPGTAAPPPPPPINEDFLRSLDCARGCSFVPWRITSGYRCPEHNREVGGAIRSAHMKGLAADIECLTSTYRYQIMTALFAKGFTRLGIGKDFIHVDADDDEPQDLVWFC